MLEIVCRFRAARDKSDPYLRARLILLESTQHQAVLRATLCRTRYRELCETFAPPVCFERWRIHVANGHLASALPATIVFAFVISLPPPKLCRLLRVDR